jgi:hypothetical protein
MSRLFNTTHKCFRAGLISGNLLKRNGERGRNRTFNLLIAQQSAKCLLFQRLLDFNSGQKWAVLGVVVMKDVMKFDHKRP